METAKIVKMKKEDMGLDYALIILVIFSILGAIIQELSRINLL